jgi:hypothetical protein
MCRSRGQGLALARDHEGITNNAEYLKHKTKNREKEDQLAVDNDSLMRYINKLRKLAAWARAIFIRSIKSS